MPPRPFVAFLCASFVVTVAAAADDAPTLDPQTLKWIASCEFDANACLAFSRLVRVSAIERACADKAPGACMTALITRADGLRALRKERSAAIRELVRLCDAGTTPACALAARILGEKTPEALGGLPELPPIAPADVVVPPAKARLTEACATGEPLACELADPDRRFKTMREACARGSIASCSLGVRDPVTLPPTSPEAKTVVEACETGFGHFCERSRHAPGPELEQARARWSGLARERCTSGNVAGCVKPVFELTCAQQEQHWADALLPTSDQYRLDRCPELELMLESGRELLRKMEWWCIIGDGPACAVAATNHAAGIAGSAADAGEAELFASFGCKHLDDPASCDFVAARAKRKVPAPLSAAWLAQLRLCRDDSTTCAWIVARVPAQHLEVQCKAGEIGACVAEAYADGLQPPQSVATVRGAAVRLDTLCRGRAPSACQLLQTLTANFAATDKMPPTPAASVLERSCKAGDVGACREVSDPWWNALARATGAGSRAATRMLSRECVQLPKNASRAAQSACAISKRFPWKSGGYVTRRLYGEPPSPEMIPLSEGRRRRLVEREQMCLAGRNRGTECERAAFARRDGGIGMPLVPGLVKELALRACDAPTWPTCELAAELGLAKANSERKGWRKIAIAPFVGTDPGRLVDPTPEVLAVEDHVRAITTELLAPFGYEVVSREATVAVAASEALAKKAFEKPGAPCRQACAAALRDLMKVDVVLIGQVAISGTEVTIDLVPNGSREDGSAFARGTSIADLTPELDRRLRVLFQRSRMWQPESCVVGTPRPTVRKGKSCLSVSFTSRHPIEGATLEILGPANETRVVELPFRDAALDPGTWTVRLRAEGYSDEPRFLTVEPDGRQDWLLDAGERRRGR